MRVSIGLLLLSVIVGGSSVRTADPPTKTDPELMFPDGASIRLVPVREKWYLGENILLHYEVRNNGVQPFDLDSGGDYRGGTRASRFIVFATSEDGTVQNDPEPHQMKMGGFGGTQKVNPGEAWYGNIWLMRYRRLAGPGRYTIRVAHDLGWKGPPLANELSELQETPDARWAETTIDVVMPDANEAQEVLAGVRAMRNRGRTMGRKQPLFPDYGCMCYPVYVRPLLKLARSHHPEAVHGIANLFAPAGTSALIELLSLPDDPQVRELNAQRLRKQQDIAVRKDESISDAAARELRRRVPFDAAQAATGWGEPSIYLKARMERTKAAWRPQHSAPVRAYATNVLLNTKPRGLRDARMEYAAQLLKAIGTKEDGPAILTAFDNVLRLSQREPLESPLTHGLIPMLRQCVKPMQIEAADQPGTAGEIAVYLQTWTGEDEHRPAEFHKQGPAWLRHPIPFVRRLTLEALPRPIPEWAINELAALVVTSDVGVRYWAAALIRDSADAQFQTVVLRQIAVESDQWVMRRLDEAAYAAGVPRDQVLRTWARRLNDVTYDSTKQRFGIGYEVFSIVRENVIEDSGGSGADGSKSRADPGLVTRWLAFIEANETELRGGRKYKVGDPELTEDLFPGGVYIYFKGKRWPPESADDSCTAQR